jgi:hypothetical protein
LIWRKLWKKDFLKTKKICSKSNFRSRSGSGRFSNMPYHIREPYWGLHESGNNLRKKKAQPRIPQNYHGLSNPGLQAKHVDRMPH